MMTSAGALNPDGTAPNRAYFTPLPLRTAAQLGIAPLIDADIRLDNRIQLLRSLRRPRGDALRHLDLKLARSKGVPVTAGLIEERALVAAAVLLEPGDRLGVWMFACRYCHINR